jgi:hypothetical protein
MDVPGPREYDPLAGADGTAPPPPVTDPARSPAHPSDLRLPPLTDAEGVARWMDEDRERGLRPWRPQVRDVPPPRPLPQQRRQRRQRTLPPETPDGSTAVTGGPPEDEPSWRRERREEAEFRAQFGEWRPGRASAPASGGFLGGVRLGAPLLVLIAILITVAALALHL